MFFMYMFLFFDDVVCEKCEANLFGGEGSPALFFRQTCKEIGRYLELHKVVRQVFFLGAEVQYIWQIFRISRGCSANCFLGYLPVQTTKQVVLCSTS